MTVVVEPYRRGARIPALVALLTDRGEVVSEHGDRLELDRLPDGCRVFTSYDVCRSLLVDGYGEALTWNREEIRWRHRHHDEPGWVARPSDVAVLKIPFPDRAETALRGLAGWRDWLRDEGAGMGGGTTGAAAWSLLRATLSERLWLGVGETPLLRQTLGGRQQLGPHGPGSFRGPLVQLDLPAAYASTLGGLAYGGRWISDRGDPGWWASDGTPVFVRATVRVKRGWAGPLPRRPRSVQRGLAAALLGAYYPTGCRMTGVWSWQEVHAAVCTNSASICKVHDVWVHLAGDRRPFAAWWQAVQRGRQMTGLAGQLAKMTGNALWGQFCMDASSGGERGIARGDRGTLQHQTLPLRGGRRPDHALAETVAGRVRAELYRMMLAAGDRLVSAHTDGVWVRDADADLATSQGNWRQKESASAMDVLGPQVLRYWPTGGRRGPYHVFAGMPAALQPAAFDELWHHHHEEAR